MHPDFMLIGAMRSGTTTLHSLLAEHHAVSMSDPKETHHFVAQRYARFRGPGDRWVASQVISDRRAYDKLVRPRDGASIAGEASATYFHYPDVLAKIAHTLRTVKVILLLREPVARAHSAYWYLRSQGRESVRTFEAALELEHERIAADYGPMWQYVTASHYAERLQACYSHFGRERVFVSTTDRLRIEPQALFDDVCAFLGVESRRPVDVVSDNASGVPRSAVMTKVLNPPTPVRRAIRRLMPTAVMTLALNARRRSLRSVPPVDPKTATRLREKFRLDVDTVARLSGVDVEPWQY